MDFSDQTNLIVNYLPQSLTDDEFRSMFLSIGPVKTTKVVRDKNTGYSYGFGFVDYTMHADAKRAIETLNGLQLQHKTIKVAFSRQGDENRGGNLYVTNIGRSVTDEQLKAIFCKFGELVQCRIVCDKHTGLSKGIGFVLFMSKEDAETAKEHLNGTIPEGCTEQLTIKFAMDNREKAKGMINKMAHPGPPRAHPPGGYGPSQDDYYDECNFQQNIHPMHGPPLHPPMGYGRGGRGGAYMGGGRGDGGWGPGPYSAGPMRRNDNGGRGGKRFNPMGGGPNSGGSAGYSGGGGGDGEGGNILFVYNIGTDATENTLWSLFAPYGAVSKVNIILSPDTEQCRGFGFVTMVNYQDALNAIKNLDGCPFGNKNLQVSFKRNDKK